MFDLVMLPTQDNLLDVVMATVTSLLAACLVTFAAEQLGLTRRAFGRHWCILPGFFFGLGLWASLMPSLAGLALSTSAATLALILVLHRRSFAARLVSSFLVGLAILIAQASNLWASAGMWTWQLSGRAGIAGGLIAVLAMPLIVQLGLRRRQRNSVEERRLWELLNLASEGLMTFDDGRIQTCNISFRGLTGFRQGDLCDDVVSSAGMEVLRSAPGKPQVIDIRDRAGTVIPVEASLRLFAAGERTFEALTIRDLRPQLAERETRETEARARLEAEQRFRLLIQGVTDYAIYMLDTEGRVANWNAGAERNKGYTAAEIVGQHFSTFFSEQDREEGLPQKMLATALREGKFEAEGWRYRKDGTRFWASVLLEPVRDDDGIHIGFAKITHDSTRQRADAEALQTVKHKLQLALENMSQGIALFDEEQRFVLANCRLAELLGADSIQNMSIDDLSALLATRVDLASESFDGLYNKHRDLWQGQDGGEILLDFLDGRTILIVHRPVPGGGWVSTLEDVSERTRSERQIVHMARHDGLTGLPNRASFSEHMRWALDNVRDDKSLRLAVLGIDLDRFKEINDHMGHSIGDEVLVALATRMSAVLQDDEFVARFGGDEFAAYKTFATDEELADFQQRVMGAICGQLTIAGSPMSVGASIGFAVFPDDALHYDKLMANADLAMYRAKASLSEKICRYEPEMDEASRDRQALARDLWRALENDEFYLHHQIQKSVSTGETTGYEVLLRWNHPQRGPVSPADFIPVAEECGAILPIGDWVLHRACSQAAGWAGKVRIAVNLSPVQLNNPDFVPHLKAILAETGLEPWRLELEVTESAIIAGKERALFMLGQIKDLGVTIAIDDFGTGYSSLETLRAFPFDKIKLDRSFIREVETSRQSKAIIRAILALGRSLEVPVLAEGVETPAQLSLLQHEGCDEAQGYFLGRPGILTLPEPAETSRVA